VLQPPDPEVLAAVSAQCPDAPEDTSDPPELLSGLLCAVVGSAVVASGSGVASSGVSRSVLLVHCVPFHHRMVSGWPVGSGYQPAGGLLMGSP
jgi:hypothetical protein